jgi:predicted aspartyl protease
MPRLFIPINLGDCRPGAVNDFAGRPPVTAVHVACDAHWSTSKKDLPNHNGEKYLALIDTGAEATAIDAVVAARIGAKPVHNAIVHGMNAAGVAAKGTDVQIIFPSCNLVFAARAVIRDFRAAGQTWDLILGRSFLKNCRLTVDGPNELYQLEWIG